MDDTHLTQLPEQLPAQLGGHRADGAQSARMREFDEACWLTFLCVAACDVGTWRCDVQPAFRLIYRCILGWRW